MRKNIFGILVYTHTFTVTVTVSVNGRLQLVLLKTFFQLWRARESALFYTCMCSAANSVLKRARSSDAFCSAVARWQHLLWWGFVLSGFVADTWHYGTGWAPRNEHWRMGNRGSISFSTALQKVARKLRLKMAFSYIFFSKLPVFASLGKYLKNTTKIYLLRISWVFLLGAKVFDKTQKSLPPNSAHRFLGHQDTKQRGSGDLERNRGYKPNGRLSQIFKLRN